MADNDKKRFYWLRLKKDFFQQHQIKVLKSLPNGRLYALIYLELLAESTSHDGELRYSQMLPYDIITLSAVIDEDKDNVEKAIETLINLELVEILEDGTIFMREIQRLIGSESGSAERQRIHRQKVKELNNVTLSQKCHLENRDKSIEIRDKKEEEDIKIIANRFLEAGYSQEIINRTLDVIYRLKINLNTSVFTKVLDIVEKDNVVDKVAYCYEVFRKEGLI